MPRKLPKIISQEEFERLFEMAHKKEKNAKSASRKNTIKLYRIAMLLGFEAGMRISEIIGYNGISRKNKKGMIIEKEIIIPPLTKDRVTNNSIRIMLGKGEKDRVVPRPKRFNNKAINKLPLNIKRRALQNFITELGKKILDRKISFHTLRHGFGSHLASQNRPLHEIQMLMGHSRLDTTGIYLHANPKKAIDGARDVF